MIKKYQLQYSILHFQIFLVDRDNKIYPTDMKCQTGPIYEYEGKLFFNSKNIKFVSSYFRKGIGQFTTACSSKSKTVGET